MAALKSFHPFPRLPIELRLKIWHAALPSRVVEPDIDCDSGLIFGEHNRKSQTDRRRIPSIFAGNSESRNYCLEQYIPFAGTYIHPTLDTLLFSSDDENRFWLDLPSFSRIDHQPAGKVKVVAIEVEYEHPENTDFRGHLHWIRGLGCPQELVICLAPSRESSAALFEHYQRIYGTSQINGLDGNRSRLVKWPGNIDTEKVQQIRPNLVQALQEEKISRPDFKIPIVRQELYFAYSV